MTPTDDTTPDMSPLGRILDFWTRYIKQLPEDTFRQRYEKAHFPILRHVNNYGGESLQIYFDQENQERSITIPPFRLRYTYDEFRQAFGTELHSLFYLKYRADQESFALDLHNAAVFVPRQDGRTTLTQLRLLLDEMVDETPETTPKLVELGTRSGKLLALALLSLPNKTLHDEVEHAFTSSGLPPEARGRQWFWTSEHALVAQSTGLIQYAKSHEWNLIATRDPLVDALRALGFQGGEAYKIQVAGIRGQVRYWISPPDFAL